MNFLERIGRWGGTVLLVLTALLPVAQAAAQSSPHPLFVTPPPARAASKPPAGPHSLVGAQTPQTAPAARMEAVTHTGEERGGLGAVRWNAGEIEAWRTGHLDHTFTLKNVSARPLTVSRLQGSCGCETLILARNGVPATKTTLAPGETAQVRVSVALRPGQNGEMHKFAWAYGPDQHADPLATMEIAMTVRAPAVFAPSVLDFGTLTVGAVKSVAVTVTADTDALAGRPIPTPGASGGGVAVTPDGPETAATQDGHPARSRRFQVALTAPAEAGPISGTVTLSGLFSAGVPLTGTILGNLAALPRSLFFGAVPAGTGVTREASLSLAVGERGRTLSASSGSPWLTTRVRTDEGTNPVLEVSLKPGTPVGVVQTQVVVTSSSGEHLSIPVVGEVLPAVPR